MVREGERAALVALGRGMVELKSRLPLWERREGINTPAPNGQLSHDNAAVR